MIKSDERNISCRKMTKQILGIEKWTLAGVEYKVLCYKVQLSVYIGRFYEYVSKCEDSDHDTLRYDNAYFGQGC